MIGSFEEEEEEEDEEEEDEDRLLSHICVNSWVILEFFYFSFTFTSSSSNSYIFLLNLVLLYTFSPARPKIECLSLDGPAQVHTGLVSVGQG